MSKQKLAKILRIVLLAGIPAAALLQEIAVLISYDQETHYFVANAPLPILANVLTAVLVVVALLSALMAPKPLDTSSPFGKQIWIALPAALGFAIAGCFFVIEFLTSRAILSLVSAVFLLFSAIHLVLSETDHKPALLGYFPPLACSCLVCILYFDTSLEMNAPLKVAVQCALLPLMLYFTAELRFLIGYALPRLFSALALVSLATSSLCFLTIPVASIMGRLENTNCLIATIAVIGINATIALRQWRYLQAPDTTSPDENDMKETDAQ